MNLAVSVMDPVADIASPVTEENAAERFDAASRRELQTPELNGRGIIFCAGGPFVPSAYVAVRLLRHYGNTLPIEIWHAGEDEIPPWARRAFEPWDVKLQDVMPFACGRPQKQMRGWPIKTAALVNSKFKEVLFLDADCFPLRNPEFLFGTPEYTRLGGLFWPDNKFHKMVDGASIWRMTGLSYRGDVEFETGIMAIDKSRRWRELNLADWMNQHSTFWYHHTTGDKDTLYLAWRKLGTECFVGPACKRYSAVITRHFWADGPLADHRTGASKYALPTRKYGFRSHLAPPSYRPLHKNVYDELMQRFIVRNYGLHAHFLDELAEVRDYHAPVR
jgi:hypothetical protein